MRHCFLACLLCLSAACGSSPMTPPPPAYDFGLPPGFPAPKVPDDNPMSAEKVTLGRHLFYDKKLSGNQTYSCASCHKQELAFTDGRATAIGSTGQSTPRSAMTLTNAGYVSSMTWANPTIATLEDQAMVPMFNEHPVELGLSGMETVFLGRLRADASYPAMFAAAFPAMADPISVGTVVRAIAAFERTLISGNTPYDRFIENGDMTALSASAQRGMDLFFSEKCECYHCHGDFAFSDAVVSAKSAFAETAYHNTGLYNIGGTGAYPPGNTGIREITGKQDDMGKFRAPTLRNIALTAPYFHDGTAATLNDVLDHYAHGGRLITTGPYAGDGSKSPYKGPFVRGFTLSDQERQDLLAFLNSLTDDEFIHNPKFSDPFAAQ